MAFALQLNDSLELRHSQLDRELASGESLESILTKHLLAVEAAATTDLLTSILLLDETGKRVRHCAAPHLPPAYCEAINGAEIGPTAGSCGTAAFFGRPVYVSDIASDPLWTEYRDIALPHGLQACWSTPIFDHERVVLGTFAIYHRTPRSPTAAEVSAIALISGHVAAAIIRSRLPRGPFSRAHLRLVQPSGATHDKRSPAAHAKALLAALAQHREIIDRWPDGRDQDELTSILQTMLGDSRRLLELLRHANSSDSEGDARRP